jgi:hypothetical protein
MRLGASGAVTESIPAAILDSLTLEAVEWLPSGADTGLLRVRGRWAVGVAHPPGLPVLCAQTGGEVSRVDSLPDAPSARTSGAFWRGAYLVPEAVARAGLWLEWDSGERSALPTPAGLDERATRLSVPEPAADPEPGGEVIDRAVLAERRARRAEAAEQAQARVASEALRALDALELRGSELEERVEALAAERDALAEQARALEQQIPRDEHRRRALADALAAAAAARRQAREWRLRMRASEVARTSDAVRLRVLEAREASGASLRAERAEQAAALEAERARAHDLTEAALRARRQAVAAAADLDAVRRDLGRRLEASERSAAAWEGRATEAEPALERARRELAARGSELARAQSELERGRAAVSALRSELEAERAEVASTGAALRAESIARSALEDELERERAARNVLSDALDAETDALASLHVELNAERTARAAARSELHALRDAGPDPELQEELKRERAARHADQTALAALRADLTAERTALGSLRDELAAERAAREADQVALGSLRADLAAERAAREADQAALGSLRADLAAERAEREALRAELDVLREEVARDSTGELRAEVEAGRAADQGVVAGLRADLDAERAAREADQAVLASLRAELEAAHARLAETGAGRPDRAAGLAAEIEFQRRAREQTDAAAAHVPDAESGRVVADLDAAASALRERVENGSAAAPAEAAPAEPDTAAPGELSPQPAPAEDPDEPKRRAATTDDRSAATLGSAPAVDVVPAAAPAERARLTIESPRSGPPRKHATGSAQRQYPWLRGALVKLAHDDPQAAGRIIAGLLPVQSLIVQGPIDYDLTITEIGTFSVSVNSGRAYVNAISEPRGRRDAEFHLSADALTLAELIAGVPHRLGRFRGPARVSGRKRRTKPLRSIRTASLSLAEAARAGARLEPDLVFRTFPYVVHPTWSRQQSFTVAQQILGDPPETWYLVVGDGGLRVLSTPPEAGADATVTMTREAFGQLLRGEPVPAGQRPSIRGDRAAVALLQRWLDRAQGL